MRQGSVDSVLIRQVELYRKIVPFWLYYRVSDHSLALVQMRVTLARLIWNYDVTLKSSGQLEPIYDHRSISAGKLEVCLRKVERH